MNAFYRRAVKACGHFQTKQPPEMPVPCHQGTGPYREGLLTLALESSFAATFEGRVSYKCAE